MNTYFIKSVILFIFLNISFLRSQTPINQIEGLESITFYEVTAGMHQYSFDLDSYELNNRYLNHLNSLRNDFEGWVGNEFYDVFISDADGAINVDGAYITIEATFHISSGGGGLNIAGISFDFDDGNSIFCSYVASHQGLGGNYVAGSELNAADSDLTTHTTMGHTASQNPAKLRLTMGFGFQKTYIEYVGCTGDNYRIEVNGITYDESNPQGAETLTAVNGCDSIINISLEFRDCDSFDNELCKLLVPNVFTPNGDRINDEFSVFENKNCEIVRFSVSIFDRWGNLVFSSNDKSFKWDGTKDLEKVLPGVYSYVIFFTPGNEKQMIIGGDVTIIH